MKDIFLKELIRIYFYIILLIWKRIELKSSKLFIRKVIIKIERKFITILLINISKKILLI